MAVSGRPEDMCDQRPYPGKAGIGSLDREMLLSGERGHGRSATAAGERPDDFGTPVVNRSSPTWTFSPARLVYAGTRRVLFAFHLDRDIG